MKKKLTILLCHLTSDINASISYHHGWRYGFRNHSRFDCKELNLASPYLRNKLFISFLRKSRLDAVVILHSAFANSQLLTGHFFDYVKSLKVPKIFFVGNEYKLIPEKIEFARELDCSLFITQAENKSIEDMYSRAVGCVVASLPNAGLSEDVFFPATEFEERSVDFGFRAAEEPKYFGHQDRLLISDYFLKNAERLDLKVDIAYNQQEKRFSRNDYAAFLNRCKGQLGTEGGPDYFELDDRTRLKVNDYVNEHPDSTMEEIFDLFFKNYRNPIPLRIISGRNVEAAGTKTVQILFEGRYSGYLEPDVHYIPLKKDFSNFEEVMAKFGDDDYCRQLTENAYKLALQEFTFEKLINRFYRQLMKVL